jgi:hypothetical protein
VRLFSTIVWLPMPQAKIDEEAVQIRNTNRACLEALFTNSFPQNFLSLALAGKPLSALLVILETPEKTARRGA